MSLMVIYLQWWDLFCLYKYCFLNFYFLVLRTVEYRDLLSER